MERVAVGAVELCFDVVGPRGGAPILLVAGHGAQLQWWDEGFCDSLAAEGFCVVRFDNRDAGTSSALASAAPPDLGAIWRGEPTPIAYTLWDMADDAAGLLAVGAYAWRRRLGTKSA
jgi:pimeloyl-ACP methyl ester carboxylesterase